MKIHRFILTGLCAALLVVLVAPDSQSQSGPVRAYVPSDFGDTTAIVTRMESLGWIVTTTGTLEMMPPGDGSGAFAAFDVVWVDAPTDGNDRNALHDLIQGEFGQFAERGGVLVVLNVGGDEAEVAPLGLDVVALLPTSQVYAVAIADVGHPLITGVGTGGVPLTDSDLDPGATGGLGFLINGPSGATTIAENAAGPVLLEYDHVYGRVLIGSLVDSSANAIDNVIRYINSVVR